MAVEYKYQDYTTGKQILVFPPYVGASIHIQTTNDLSFVTVDARKIIKAGTIYPANDETLLGLWSTTWMLPTVIKLHPNHSTVQQESSTSASSDT